MAPRRFVVAFEGVVAGERRCWCCVPVGVDLGAGLGEFTQWACAPLPAGELRACDRRALRRVHAAERRLSPDGVNQKRKRLRKRLHGSVLRWVRGGVICGHVGGDH